MPSKQERQAIRVQLKQQEREAFVESLPVDQALFKRLFDYLDEKLHIGCNHTDMLTREFLGKNCDNTEEIIAWLSEHGGFCDCEVLWNVDQVFQDMKVHHE